MYRADLRPTKLQMLNDWLPRRPWYEGPGDPEFQRVAAFRFDDPAGQVGIETLLVRSDGGPILQVPLTYRGTPLDGLEPWLLGTTEHSVLGTRWVYDGCADPVYVNALAHAILTGGTQAEEFIDVDGEIERREPSMQVRGSGAVRQTVTPSIVVTVVDANPTLIRADAVELGVVRVLGAANGAATGEPLTLTGTWDGQPEPTRLGYAREF